MRTLADHEDRVAYCTGVSGQGGLFQWRGGRISAGRDVLIETCRHHLEKPTAVCSHRFMLPPRTPRRWSPSGWHQKKTGGGGIRTPETLSRLTVFKTVAFSRSATPPTRVTTGDTPWQGLPGVTRSTGSLRGYTLQSTSVKSVVTSPRGPQHRHRGEPFHQAGADSGVAVRLLVPPTC